MTGCDKNCQNDNFLYIKWQKISSKWHFHFSAHTYWGLLTDICVSELSHHWFRKWLGRHLWTRCYCGKWLSPFCEWKECFFYILITGAWSPSSYLINKNSFLCLKYWSARDVKRVQFIEAKLISFRFFFILFSHTYVPIIGGKAKTRVMESHRRNMAHLFVVRHGRPCSIWPLGWACAWSCWHDKRIVWYTRWLCCLILNSDSISVWLGMKVLDNWQSAMGPQSEHGVFNHQIQWKQYVYEPGCSSKSIQVLK